MDIVAIIDSSSSEFVDVEFAAGILVAAARRHRDARRSGNSSHEAARNRR
ncbi:MAG TPA: hypothetical protein VMQ61_14525 [Thermoanaerobaculia bacterium]|nr:hypothetical protein [Thermoanaerobaculia bacterium]